MADDLVHMRVRKALASAEGVMNLDVEADIPFGSLTALFGPSGAGKTTILRMLAGLTKPDEGTIQFGEVLWFDGARRVNIPPQQRHIGMMFQDYALFPNMTVEQNIQFAQEERDPHFTHQLLEVLQLTELAKSDTARLSGGQKQRVALARALARKPQLLLLDEPLSALDAGMRAALQEEILRVHQLFASTTVFVSHDLHEVVRLASHIIRLEHGKVVATGNPEQVFSQTITNGKFQVVGQIASIEIEGTANAITVITGNDTLVKISADGNDLSHLTPGDNVLVVSKAFDPVIKKL